MDSRVHAGCSCQGLHGPCADGMAFTSFMHPSIHKILSCVNHTYLCLPSAQAHVSVLLNDAVGTFAGGRYEDEDVMMGVIMGTGTNACYVEKRSNIHHAKLPSDAHGDSMIINTEWGGFHGESLPVGAVPDDMSVPQLHACCIRMKTLHVSGYDACHILPYPGSTPPAKIGHLINSCCVCKSNQLFVRWSPLCQHVRVGKLLLRSDAPLAAARRGHRAGLRLCEPWRSHI